MDGLDSTALRYQDGRLLVLDQRQLPTREQWVHCTSPDHMCHIIRTLQVRGAPLIGIAAALALADFGARRPSPTEIREAANRLLAARPTAVNLRYAMELMVLGQENIDPPSLAARAAALFREDQQLCERMAEHGAALMADGDRILTHCNTGSLVTTGIGTALGAIKRAWQQGKDIHVYVDETRPLLQGARLTTWELERAGVPYTLICDNMAASMMAQGRIGKVFVGADRIARNGDVANKIGTYGTALAAHFHGLPFHVVAPYTTVDPRCESGAAIPIEEREPDEVRGYAGMDGPTVLWAPPRAPACNPAFDVTPARLVTSIVLDLGIFTVQQLREGALTNLPDNSPPGQAH